MSKDTNLKFLKGPPRLYKKTDTVYIEFIPALLERCGSDPQAVLDILLRYFKLYTVQNDELIAFTYNETTTKPTDLLGIAITN